MTADHDLPAANDKLLFTPGPLTTSRDVKLAMLRDLGSRDVVFIETVRRVRQSLLEVAGVSRQDGYEVVLMQGSGTFGIEAVVSSVVPPGGKLLVAVNGAYGRRIAKIAAVHKIDCRLLEYPENARTEPADVDEALREDPSVTTVAIVHCETTTGIMNPVAETGAVVARHKKTYFVDSMSAFGAVPLDLKEASVDFLVSSANKCIEGVPGFSFAICRREALVESEGRARTVSLDLAAQWRGLEADGQFRFTPPTHTILAFEQALRELQVEGGVAGRAARYGRNHACLVAGMREIGFEPYIAPALQGHVITSFRYPDDPGFEFEAFYEELNSRGFVIYPGKVSDADCFRIGNIGRLFEAHIRALLGAVRETLAALGSGGGKLR